VLALTILSQLIPISRLHLHVISQDFTSPSLKKAVHWNSFNTGFFVSPEEVIDTIRKQGSFAKTPDELKAYSQLKKAKMTCNQCSEVMKTVPMLQRHMSEHYAQKVDAYKQQHGIAKN